MKKTIKKTTGFSCALFSILLSSTVAHADIKQPTARHLGYPQFSHHQVKIQTTVKGLSNAAATLMVTAYENGANGQQKVSQTVTAYNKKGERINQLSPVISHATTDSFTGNTLSIADAKGNITSKTYDALARTTRIAHKNAQGSQQETLTYTMNSVGSAVTTRFPDGTTSTALANQLGQSIAIKNSQHGATPIKQFTYNDLGQQYQTTTLEGIQNTTHFNAQGQAISRTTGMQGQPVQLTHYTSYDNVANKIETYDQGSDGRQTGNVEKYSDDNNQVMQTVANPARSLDVNVGAVNAIKQFVIHDNLGQMVELNAARDDNARRVTHYTLDAQGNVTRTLIDATKKNDTYLQVDFAHDNLAGILSSKTLKVLNADGRVKSVMTRYQKDFSPAGQLLSVKLLGDRGKNNSLTQSRDYDELGNITTMHDWHLSSQREGATVSYGYTNVLGKEKVSTIVVPAHDNYPAYTIHTERDQRTGEITDTYKQIGDSTKKTDWIKYRHEDTSHPHWLTSKIYSYELPAAQRQTIQYRHDPISERLTAMINPLGYITKYTYGDKKNPARLKDQLSKVMLYKPDGTTALAEVDYNVDSLQREASKSRFLFDSESHRTAVDSYCYTYGSFGDTANISHQLDTENGRQVEKIHYELDQQGYITHETYTQSDKANYREITSTYDNLHRLIESDKVEHQAGQQNPTTIKYKFDANSNMIKKTVNTSATTMTDRSWDDQQAGLTLTYNGFDQIQSFANTTSATSKPPSYEASSGDLVRDETGLHYAHDGLHKLRELTDSSGKRLASYDYGSDGMRRSKADTKTTLHYIYNDKQLLATTDNYNNAAFYLLGKTREARFVLKAGQTQPSIRFYGYDNHTVSNTLDFNNQGQAAGMAYHHYEDYGQAVDNSGEQTGRALSISYDPFSAGGFGEYAEQETQGRLQYRPAREYVSSLHQFASLDTDNRFNNRYGYGEGNPRMKFDPSGNSALFLGIQSLAAAVGGIAKFAFQASLLQSSSMLIGGIADVGMGLAMIPTLLTACNSNKVGQTDAILSLIPMAAGLVAGAAGGMMYRAGKFGETASARMLTAGAGALVGAGFSVGATWLTFQYGGQLNGMYDYTHDLSRDKMRSAYEMAAGLGFLFGAAAGEFAEGKVASEEGSVGDGDIIHREASSSTDSDENGGRERNSDNPMNESSNNKSSPYYQFHYLSE